MTISGWLVLDLLPIPHVSVRSSIIHKPAAADDNPDWIEDDFKCAVPFSTLPELLQTKLLGLKGCGKQKSPTKVSTTIRFDSDVLESFRAIGRSWQTRMNEALKEWLKTHASG